MEAVGWVVQKKERPNQDGRPTREGRWNPGHLKLEEVEVSRHRYRLGTAFHFQLAVKVVDMGLNRTCRYDEFIGDMLVG